jgi:putative spermidine/putrescine transport system permease protein
MSSRSLDRIAVFLFVLLVLAPVTLSLVYAALYGAGLAGLFASGVTIAHWRKVIEAAETWASLGLSVSVAGAVVILTTAIALPLSLAFRKRLQAGYLAYALTLPLAIPGTVAGLLGMQLLGGAGLVSRICFHLGLSGGVADFPPLIQDPWAIGIVITHFFLAVPFFVFLFAEIHASERIGPLCELAAMLGARSSQSLRRVALPILLRQARPTLALLFVVVLASFEIPLMLGRQAPQMASVLIWRKYALFDVSQKPEAYVLALSFALIALAIAGLGIRRRGASDVV